MRKRKIQIKKKKKKEKTLHSSREEKSNPNAKL